LADVPTARELAPDDHARALIELAELPYLLSRPFAAPPDLPPSRAKALQDAFLAVHKDPDYLADAEKLKVDVSPLGGAAALQSIEKLAATPAGLRAELKRMMAERQ
jgi:ABC-type phosphate/phosphonate transport system substrate-binding protein